jgi:hypothetical protein
MAFSYDNLHISKCIIRKAINCSSKSTWILDTVFLSWYVQAAWQSSAPSTMKCIKYMFIYHSSEAEKFSIKMLTLSIFDNNSLSASKIVPHCCIITLWKGIIMCLYKWKSKRDRYLCEASFLRTLIWFIIDPIT